MKLLTIEGSQGFFIADDSQRKPIEQITKADLLMLANKVLEGEVEIDEDNESNIKNPAQQIIYKSVSKKLLELSANRETFRDQSETLFHEEYEKYKSAPEEAS